MNSDLFAATHALLSKALGSNSLRVDPGPPARMSLPAAHPAVGDLVVQDDETELTISLGEHHHWHASPYHHREDSEAARLEAAARDVFDSIEAVLSGRTVLRITRRDGRVRSTTTYRADLTDAGPLGPEDEEFTWSGPRRMGTP